MSLAWVILFPLGAAIIRFFKDRFSSGRQAMVVHRALQIGNFLLVLIALALGCAASDENSTVSILCYPSPLVLPGLSERKSSNLSMHNLFRSDELPEIANSPLYRSCIEC